MMMMNIIIMMMMVVMDITVAITAAVATTAAAATIITTAVAAMVAAVAAAAVVNEMAAAAQAQPQNHDGSASHGLVQHRQRQHQLAPQWQPHYNSNNNSCRTLQHSPCQCPVLLLVLVLVA